MTDLSRISTEVQAAILTFVRGLGPDEVGELLGLQPGTEQRLTSGRDGDGGEGAPLPEGEGLDFADDDADVVALSLDRPRG